MKENLDIVKILREEERLGKLTAQSQGSYEELETPGEVLEDMPDESITIMEDAEKDDFYEESTQNGDLSSNESVDEKELIFQSSNDLMMYIDKFGKLLKINKAGLAFSGFSEEEVIGKMFWKIPGVFSKGNALKFLNVFKNALKGKPTRNFVGNLDDKSGKTHIMDFSAFPVKENKKLKYVFVVAKELTEQKEAESRYRLITENTSDLICLTTFTLNPIYNYVSPSYKKVMGYEPDDLIGKPTFDFVHPDDKKNLLPLLKKYVGMKAKKLLVKKGLDVSEKFENRVRDKSGGWHYMENTADFMGDELLFVSKDVTKRKQAEQSLRDAEAEIKHTIEVVPGIIATADDHTGYFTHCNPALSNILGFSPKEFLARPFIEFIHPDDRQSTINEVKKQLKGSTVARFENRYICKDGSYKWLEWKATATDEKGLIYTAATDVTERKKAEESLVKSEEKLNVILNTVPAMIWSKDADGKYLWINKNHADSIGVQREKAPGKTDFDIFPKEQAAKFQKDDREIIKTGKAKFAIIEQYKNLDGTTRWIRTDKLPLCSKTKKIEGTIGFAVDITHRKKAESEIKYLKEYNESILESNPKPIMVVKENQIEYVNKSFVSIFGKTKRNYISKELEEVIPVAVIPVFEELLKDYDKKKELEITGKSFSVSSFVIKKAEEEEEEEERIGIILQDITEGKKAEEKLSTIISKSPIPTAVGGSNGSIVAFNEALENLIGYKKSEISDTTNWMNKLYPNKKYREFVQKNIKQALDGRKQECAEFTITCKDGSTKVVDFHTSFFKDGLVIQMVDITDRKQAEEALKESEEKYRNIVETAPDAIMAMDLKGVITSCNQAALDMVGYSRDEYVGKHFLKLGAFRKRDIPTLAKVFFNVLRGKQIAPY